MQRWNVFNEAIGQQGCIQCSSSTADLSPLSLKRQLVVVPDFSQSSKIPSLASSTDEVITLNFPQVVVAEERSNIEVVVHDNEKVGNAEVESNMQQQIHGADRNEQKHANSPTLVGLLTRGE